MVEHKPGRGAEKGGGMKFPKNQLNWLIIVVVSAVIPEFYYNFLFFRVYWNEWALYLTPSRAQVIL
jgi:hypothetical protein